ncbi:MAG: hypothetical protein ACQR33_01800 [Candidatus Saccharibacteria bacterium]
MDSPKIVLAGVTTDELAGGDSVTVSLPGTLVVLVREGNFFQVFFDANANLRHLQPGMHLCLGQDLTFYYCGRRVQLLPREAFASSGELYRLHPLRIVLKDASLHMPHYTSRLARMRDLLDGIRQTYGLYVLITLGTVVCIRRLWQKLRRRTN